MGQRHSHQRPAGGHSVGLRQCSTGSSLHKAADTGDADELRTFYGPVQLSQRNWDTFLETHEIFLQQHAWMCHPRGDNLHNFCRAKKWPHAPSSDHIFWRSEIQFTSHPDFLSICIQYILYIYINRCLCG